MTYAQERIVAASSEPDHLAFPHDFVWGAATAAYQVEGSVDADGRKPSIWDAFAAQPGRVVNGDTGEYAADHYRRWREDIGLMQQLGLGAYRFSLSWSRILPDGTGRPNDAGLDFYDRLVDGLLAAGITPWATLYHWDLPVGLESRGGWPVRDTAERFAEVAAASARRLGDRVKNWITLNEPWCSAFLGYSSGVHAPGRTDPAAAVAAAHHLLLGHGLATAVVREESPASRVGITLNLYPTLPANDSPAAADAARRVDGLQNRWFLDPVLRGRYPEDVRNDLREITDFGHERPGDLDVIAAPIDFLGVNYYSSHYVRPGAFPGSNPVEFVDRGRPRTALGWEIDHEGLTTILRRIRADYGPIPLCVTENGAAFDDAVDVDGVVHDQDRVDYLASHVLACQQAIDDGVPLTAYFVWSLLDNFEWAEGYGSRFGIVHVDFATQQRTIKDSGWWYADFLARHRDGTLRP
ncbi:MAG TPA: GH1 family beta-glucosidase [Nocardioidaceae bacterium]